MAIFTLNQSAPPKRDTEQLINTFNEHPVTRAVVDKISYAVANTPLIVVDKDNNEREHPVLEVIKAGNIYCDGFQIIKTTQIYLDTVGEAFLIKERANSGKVIGLWGCPPQWINDIPIPGNEGVYKVRYGTYFQDLPPEDVIYFKHQDPLNPYLRGRGFGHSLADEVQADENAAKHINSFFFNRAVPDSILSFEEPANEDQAKKFAQEMRRKFQGVENTWRSLVTSAKIKVQQLGHSFKDMKIVELRDFNRNQIINTFGIPPEILGIIENSNRSTIETAEFLFNKFVVEPRLNFITSTLTRQLLLADWQGDRASQGLTISYESPVEADKNYKLEVQKVFPSYFKASEIREQVGLSPNDIPETVTQPQKQRRGKAVKKQIDADPIVSSLDDDNFWQIVEAQLATLVDNFAQDQLEIVGERQRYRRNETVEQYIRDFRLTKVAGIQDKTKNEIRAILNRSIAEGMTAQEIAEEISQKFNDMSETRAALIARTESVSAANFGAIEGMNQANIKKKEWIATMDSRLRDSHKFLDGQIVGIDEKFMTGGLTAAHPGGFGVASEDINCRCAVVAVFDEQKSSPESREKLWKNFDSKLQTFEIGLEKSIRNIFDMQKQKVLEALNE